MQIMVSGASGSIGTRLRCALQRAGVRPVLLASSQASAARLYETGLPVRVASFLEPEALRRAFTGIERLFLLLPLVESKERMAANALAAARAAGVGFVLRSSGIDADPDSPWALMALQGRIDRLLAESGLPYAVLRPCSFMQNYATYHAPAIRAGRLCLPDGHARSALIDVRDIAEVAASILLDPQAHLGAIYPLTGSEALSHDEAVATINAVCGLSVEYLPVEIAEARAAMLAAGVPAWNVDILLSLAGYTRAGLAETCVDHVERLLGRPPLRFSRFVADYAASWTP